MNYKISVNSNKLTRTIPRSHDKDDIANISKCYINDLKKKKDLHESYEINKYKKAQKTLLENRRKSFESLKMFLQQLYISEMSTIKNVLDIYTTNEAEKKMEDTEVIRSDIDEKYKFDENKKEDNVNFDI